MGGSSMGHNVYRAVIDCMLENGMHLIPCRKGKEYPIPPELEDKARYFGMELVSGNPTPIRSNMETIDEETMPSSERDARIVQAMKDMVVTNDADEFAGGTGRPKANKLAKRVGFRVFSEDVTRLWGDVIAEVRKAAV